jgi:hypothetical protein
MAIGAVLVVLLVAALATGHGAGVAAGLITGAVVLGAKVVASRITSRRERRHRDERALVERAKAGDAVARSEIRARYRSLAESMVGDAGAERALDKVDERLRGFDLEAGYGLDAFVVAIIESTAPDD